MTVLNTIEEIKEAVNQGKTVYAESSLYQVIKDRLNQYMIKCTINGNCVGLHGIPGTPYENRLNMDNFFTID
jgi:hypothetical protein